MRSPAWDGDWPISQYFGVNPAGYARFGLAGHNGLDVALPEGTAIYAPCRGQIVEAAYDDGWGHYTKLTTDDGQDWIFAHFRRPALLPVGFQIPEGLVLLGESGTTGNSTGPHLHIGWRLLNAPFYRGWPFNGYIDPRQVLDRLQGGLWPPA